MIPRGPTQILTHQRPGLARTSNTLMVFTKFVQAGRLVIINYGESKDTLAVIADIVDQNRVIIDGPTTGIARQVISIKRINLTDILIPDVPRGARTKTVRKALAASGAVDAFKASEAGQKIAKATIRANLTDFERHQVMKAKKMRSYILKSAA